MHFCNQGNNASYHWDDVSKLGDRVCYYGDYVCYHGNGVYHRVNLTFISELTYPPRSRFVRDVGTQTDAIEETCITTDNCTCELCTALTAHLEDLALSMGIGSETVHLFVHVCQTCPLLAEEEED